MHGIDGRGSRMRCWAGMALAMALSTPAVQADGGAPLHLSAHLRKHATLRALHHPPSLTITPADLARGFVDLPAAVELAVRSNSPDGYALVFESESEAVRQTVVRGLDREVAVGNGGLVSQSAPGPGMAQRQHRLGFRFLLGPGAREGVHPWPLRVSVQPL